MIDDAGRPADRVADLWAHVYGPEPLKVKVLVARLRAAAARLNMEPPAPRPGDREKVELAVALLKVTGTERLNPKAVGWWLRKHPSRWERLPGRDTRWRVLHALEARPSSLDLEPKPRAVKPPRAVCKNGLHPIDPNGRPGEQRCEACRADREARHLAAMKRDQTRCWNGKHEGHPRERCKACAASRASRRALRQRARVLKDREMGLTPAKKRASRSYGMLGYK